MKKIFPDIIPALRFIHQIIVVVSIALLISIFSTRKGINISSAINDLEKIKATVDQWDDRIIEEAYFRSRSSIYDEVLFLYNYWEVELDIEEIDQTGEAQSSSHKILFNAPKGVFLEWTYVASFSYDGPVVIVPAPKSLLEFAEFWDKSQSVKRVNVGYQDILDHAYVQKRPGEPVQKVPLKVLAWDYSGEINHYGRDGIVRESIFDDFDLDESDKNLFGITYLHSNVDEYFAKVWIPVSTDMTNADEISVSRYLCYKMDIDTKEKDCNGSFEQVFPDLYYLSKDFQGLPFTYMLGELEKQNGNEFQKSINLFGFDFSSFGIYRGGIILVVLAQIYLHLLLQTFIGIMDRVEELPVWIGFFSDKFSRIITIATTLLMPLVLVLWLFFSFLNNFTSLEYWQNYLTEIVILFLVITAESYAAVYLSEDLIILWKNLDKRNILSENKVRRVHISRKNRN